MNNGRHAAKAIDIDMGYAETGTPQYAVAFELVETRETITWYGYMSEKAAERTLQSLRYCGWQGNDPGAISAADLTEEVELDIQEDEYKGETRMKVQWVNRRGGGAVLKSRMDESQRKAFGDQFRGLAMKVKPVPQTRKSETGDDDTPF